MQGIDGEVSKVCLKKLVELIYIVRQINKVISWPWKSVEEGGIELSELEQNALNKLGQIYMVIGW